MASSMSDQKWTDKFPSGSWGYGPLSLQWSLKAGNEVDVEVSVFGIDVDTLKGVLTASNTKISDSINVLGLVSGELGLEAKYGTADNSNGLYFEGDLNIPLANVQDWSFSSRIIPW